MFTIYFLGNETIFDFYLYDDKLNESSELEDLQSYSNSTECENGEEKKHEIVAVTDICGKEKTTPTEGCYSYVSVIASVI